MSKSKKIRSVVELEKHPLVKLVLEADVRFLNEVAAVEYPGDDGSVTKLESYFANRATVDVQEIVIDAEERIIHLFVDPFQDEGGAKELIAYLYEKKIHHLIQVFDGQSNYIIQDEKEKHYPQDFQPVQETSPELTSHRPAGGLGAAIDHLYKANPWDPE